MRILFFHKHFCFTCHEARPRVEALAKEHSIEFKAYDLETVDGLSEGAFAGVVSTKPLPQIFVVEPNGDALTGYEKLWREFGEDAVDLLAGWLNERGKA